MTTKSVFVPVCCLLFSGALWASLPAPPTNLLDSTRPTQYELRLFRMPGAGSSLNGYLGALNEQSITLIQPGLNGLRPGLEIPITDLKRLKFKESGSVKRGFLYGAFIGFSLGFVYGLATSGSYSCNNNSSFCIRISPLAVSLFTGLIATGPGLIIGGIVGSLRTSFPINGRQTEYERQKDKLEQYRRKGNF